MPRPGPALTLSWAVVLVLGLQMLVSAQALRGTSNKNPINGAWNGRDLGFVLEDDGTNPGYYAVAADRVQLLPRANKNSDQDDKKKDSDNASNSSSDSDDDPDDSTAIPDPPSKSIKSLSSSATTHLPNNTVVQGSLAPGDYHVYYLPNVTDDSSATVFLTANLCSVPDGATNNQSSSVLIQVAGSLVELSSEKGVGTANYTDLFLDSDVLENPDSDDFVIVSAGVASWYTGFYMGFSNMSIVTTSNTSSLYVLIRAPDNAANVSGSDLWSYELGASTSEPLHAYSSGPNLYLVDTDFAHGLLVTDGLTDEESGYENMTFYKAMGSYYDVHVFLQSEGEKVEKQLGASFCGMARGVGQLLNQGNSDISVTTRGSPAVPKLQYFMKGLNESTDYIVFLTQSSAASGATSGGGTAFPGVSLRTNEEQNCQIVYDLDFCQDVAYAVPGNASVFSAAALGAVYDEHAQGWYESFNKSLQQVSCDVREMERYSIVRTCEDCATSYRQWLCSVTIPRCMDATSAGEYLTLRGVNSSRASFIDEVIRPGPYKELLPCIGMCQAIVQDCPASMGFACPKKGQVGFDGYYMVKADDGSVQCNFPGAVYRTSGGVVGKRVGWWGYFMIVVCLSMVI